MDGAEVRAFLDVAAGDRLSAIWRLALTTGLRRGGLLGPEWDEVDQASVYVRRQVLLRLRAVQALAGCSSGPHSRTGVPARHSYAELALSSGVRLVVVSRTLGHSSSAFTADQHSHYSDEAAAEADRIGAVLRR